ncbi:MAG: CDP-alcohol phosphatidyltransferase family protein [Prevotellaceae bacterium]|nr:CDP-alcohol phosphatidyltransferase family protein [Prevotellaceae bacterium]
MNIKQNIPNLLTCGNLLCGCVATVLAAMQLSHPQLQLFPVAFLFILFGAVFDFLDGMVARLLRVSSPIGIQLDSLADCVTFGVAPSMMIFVMFSKVYYPVAMYNHAWFTYLPYTAFLLAAFSAYRLAKFNIDERQHTGFIGMPTPACAIFWGALISGCQSYLTSPMFNAPFLLAFELMFCFLLVSEIPMFALKFKDFSLRHRDNVLRISFLACSLLLILICVIAAPSGQTWSYACRGIAGSIGLYLLLNLVRHMSHAFRR